ncbi:substrate-binding periplasmic protein [Roseibium sp.]|uniref:substrate-binding periplasmic protein n=1 Tax=Roseibium sp. TaxID=1936156 RepID=UPI003B515968
MRASTQEVVTHLFLILCCFGISINVHAAEVGCERPLTVLVSDQFPPFSERSEDGSFKGLDIDIIQTVMETAGCEFKFVVVPWKRGILMLAEGKLDFVAFASITPERREFANFTAPYRHERIRLITLSNRANAIQIAELKDLARSNLVIGNSSGTYRGEEFAAFEVAHKSSGHLVDIPSSTHGIQMLLSSRIDALVADQSVAFAIAEGLGVRSQLTANPYKVFDNPVYLMASRKSVSPATLQRINSALEKTVDADVYN